MWLTRPAALTLLSGLSVAGGALAGRAVDPIQHLIRTGQAGAAIETLLGRIEQDPDDADAHALLGIARARMGLYSDALPEFRFGLGADSYEEDGIQAEADTLAAFGRHREALALRAQQRILLSDASAELILLVAEVDDARRAGDTALAEDLAWEALGLLPNAGLAWVALADVMIDQGRPDEAEFALWRSRELGRPLVRQHLVETRLALLDDDPVTAQNAVERAYRAARTSYDVSVMRVEVKRRLGLYAEAEAILDMARYRNRQYPELMAFRVLLDLDQGRLPEAREDLAAVRRLYPGHPLVRRAGAYLAWAEEHPDRLARVEKVQAVRGPKPRAVPRGVPHR